MTYSDVLIEAVAKSGRSGRDISIAAVGHESAVRSLKRKLDLRVSTVQALCNELGLKFYIGPGTETQEVSPEVAAALREVVADLQRTAKSTTGAVELLSRLTTSPEVVVIEDDSTLTEQTGEAEVVRFPASRQVDQIDLAVAAGAGAEADDEPVTERLMFRRDWLLRHGLDPSQCTVVKVQGESMEPSLPEGSSILVDRARRRRRVGGVFVVRTADGVVVKRAGKDQAGAWQFLSDHPAWNPVPWPRDAEVIGEVKWMARTL